MVIAIAAQMQCPRFYAMLCILSMFSPSWFKVQVRALVHFARLSSPYFGMITGSKHSSIVTNDRTTGALS